MLGEGGGFKRGFGVYEGSGGWRLLGRRYCWIGGVVSLIKGGGGREEAMPKKKVWRAVGLSLSISGLFHGGCELSDMRREFWNTPILPRTELETPRQAWIHLFVNAGL